MENCQNYMVMYRCSPIVGRRSGKLGKLGYIAIVP